MHVLAALGDAPTAAIAVVAIALGLFFAARGPREKRAAGGADGDRGGPNMVTLPVASAPEADPGFVGPEGDIVGHGPIRLGVHGPLGAEQAPAPEAESLPTPAPLAEPVAAEAPLPEPEPAAEERLAAEAPIPAQQPVPAAEEPLAAEAPAEDLPPPADEPAESREPAWRIAARVANDAAHFRQGPIKIGGRTVGKRKD
jgi:hypothetical protein